MKSIKRSDLLFACFLTLPIFFFFLSYTFNHDATLTPTGFIQGDNVSYMAYAKQYIDDSSFHIFYSNPLSDGPKERIYFQPQLFLLILFLKAGLPAGFCLILFSIIFSYLTFLLIIKIYDLFTADKKFRKLSLILLSWGGGLLVMSGIILSCFKDHVTTSSAALPETIWDWMFFIDPADGWWGLNFGRSLFFSMEAFYHALFLLTVYLVLQHKWKCAICTAFILSLSHPFTGLELLLIITTWLWVEKILKRSAVPLYVPVVFSLLVAFHLWYYLYYLMRFPEHAIVYQQYSLNWRLRFFNAIPAYCLAGTLLVISLFHTSIKTRFKNSSFRLAVIWLIIVFLLVNHEWFTTPRQPIHFTRGYFYTGLFLIGIPGLHYLLTRINKGKKWIIAFIVLLFLSDNILWIIKTTHHTARKSGIRYITDEQLDLLHWMDEHTSLNSLIISSDQVIPYLATVYTKAYALTPHLFTTPFIKQKKELYARFLQNPFIPDDWRNKHLIWLIDKRNTYEIRIMQERKYKAEYISPNYIIVTIK